MPSPQDIPQQVVEDALAMAFENLERPEYEEMQRLPRVVAVARLWLRALEVVDDEYLRVLSWDAENEARAFAHDLCIRLSLGKKSLDYSNSMKKLGR